MAAVKELDKDHIKKSKKTESVFREKEILNKFATHPNIIKLEGVY